MKIMHIFKWNLLDYVTEIFQIPINAFIVNCSVSGRDEVKILLMIEHFGHFLVTLWIFFISLF